MPDANDMDLVREYARHKSEQAFGELVQRHIALVYSVALRFTRNPPDAEDVTQAVFMILARKAAGLRAGTILTGWLYETTRLTSLQWVRNQIRRQNREQEVHMQSTLDNSNAGSAWREVEPLLEQAMSRLNEKDRTLLALRFFENRSSPETAALLGIGEWAARKRTNRALEKLRIFFAKRGVASTTMVIAQAISANSVHAAPTGLAQTISVAAMVKGAAASTSTVTLVKGALKTMAWTKTKTGVAIGVAAILAVTSTTMVGYKLALLHRSTAKPAAAGLFPVAVNATGTIQPDGTVLCQGTLTEINTSRRPIRTDSITEAGDVALITDESGNPLRFVSEPNNRYSITLKKPVPPGGKVSYTMKGAMVGLIKPNVAGDFEVGFTNDAGNVTDMHCVQVWRLPVGAMLLSKISEMQESVNDGQIELRIDKVVPPNGSLPVGFSYRLAASAP